MARGNVRVSIDADVRGLKRGVDQANRSLGSLNKSVGMFKRVGGALAGAFAVSEVVNFATESVKAYEEVIKVNKQTEAVLKSTGHAAGMQKKDILDLAQAISRKTAIDDEQIQSAENLLLTFTKIGKETFPQVTKTVVDMSVALGQDFKSSSIQVGKALNDPIKGLTALQRVGVSFTADQKKQIEALVESGKTLEAQKMILRELSREFGGSAEKAATPMMRMKVAVGNLKEEVGKGLYPVITDLANKMAPFIQGFVDGTGAGGRFRDKLREIWKAAQPTVKAIGQLAVGIGKFVEKNPALLKVAAGIAAVGLAVKTIRFASALSGMSTFVSAASGLGKKLLPIFRSIGTRAGISFATASATEAAAGTAANMASDLGPGSPARGRVTKTFGSLGRVSGIAFDAALLLGAVAAGQALANKIYNSAYDWLKSKTPKWFQAVLGAGNFLVKVNPITGGPGRTVRGQGGGPEDLVPNLVKGGQQQVKPIKTPRLDTTATVLSAKTLNKTIKNTWDRLKSDTSTSLDDIQKDVARNTRRIKRSLDTDTDAGAKALRGNFRGAISAVKTQMRRGVVSVQDGTNAIRRILAQALVTFGIRNVKLGITDVAGSLFAASGGWIGAPGQAGRDTVPAMLGVGEAVLNRHQQVPVENALQATYGMGLDDLFARVRRPHYLAEGGRPNRLRNQQMRRGLGVVTRIGQRVLDREDRAAERYLDKLIGDPTNAPAGTRTMDGKPVAIWIYRLLQRARNAGVSFGVSSGFRSRAEQTRLWNQLGRDPAIVARPGTSNHEGSKYPRGAVDISPGWQGLESWLQSSGQSKWLKHYGNPRDPWHFSHKGNAFGGFIRRFAKGGWVKTGATRYDDPPPGAGNLGRSGYHFAELGTATKGGKGTGRGYLARLFGMSGELAMGTKLEIRRGGKTITADKQDRGYGQGSSSYAIDLWRGAADALGVSKGQVEVRLVTGGTAQTKTSELDKKHRALDKQWRAEMRKSSPRSKELLKISNEGLKLTAGQKSRRGKQLRQLWMSRHSYAVKQRTKRRAANLRTAAADRRTQNTETLGNILEGNYLAAQLNTPDDLTDDAQWAARGLRFAQGKQAEHLADWNAGKLTDPGVLSADQTDVETWRERYNTATGQTPAEGTTDTGTTPEQQAAEAAKALADAAEAIRGELEAMRKRAEFIGNTADGALARAVTAVVSGQIGGQVGLGFASPSYTGSYARY